MRRALLLPLALALAACVTAAPRPAPPPDPGTLASCGADRLIGLIGAPVSALPATGLPEAVRILRPGDAVTMDFSERRLNVTLDAADRIAGLGCG
jgi:hypothetical protein